MLALWRDADPPVAGDGTQARLEIVAKAERIRAWFDLLSESLVRGLDIPDPLGESDPIAPEQRTATAARLVWTDLHLEFAIRLQATIVDSARQVVRTPRSTFELPKRLRLRAAEA